VLRSLTAGAARATPAFTGTATVGDSTALSGPAASLGRPGIQGIELALSDVNAKGGLLRREIKLASADDACNPAAGTTNVRNLILNDKVVALFGPVCSNVAAAQESVAAQYKMPIFFHTSNDAVMTTKNFTKYAVQVVPNTYMEPRAVASYLSKQPYRRYYTIGPDYSYGHDTTDAFLKAMKEFGANIEVVGQQWPKLGTSDFSSFISAILSARPDFVFATIFAGDILTFTKQAAGFGFFKRVKFGGPYDIGALAALGSQAPAGVVAWQRAPFYAINTPEVADFAQRYHEKYGAWPNEFALIAYTAVQVWAHAVRRVGSFDGDLIAAALGGATVPTIRGPIAIRACDHMAEIPEYVGTIAASPDPKYGFPILERVFIAPPSAIMMNCQEAQSLQPK
jgi:branched-chain amino acid transport system substrate-binding protein